MGKINKWQWNIFNQINGLIFFISLRLFFCFFLGNFLSHGTYLFIQRNDYSYRGGTTVHIMKISIPHENWKWKLTILFANASVHNRKSTQKIKKKTVNHHMLHTTRLKKEFKRKKKHQRTHVACILKKSEFKFKILNYADEDREWTKVACVCGGYATCGVKKNNPHRKNVSKSTLLKWKPWIWIELI